MSTAVLVLSTITLAYCEAVSEFIVDLFGVGAGDWDVKRKRLAANTAIGIAVFQFYLLDFALNALQASLRNLLLDITPPSQLNAGNAWHGRMTHLGNIVGTQAPRLSWMFHLKLTRLFSRFWIWYTKQS